MLPSTSHEQDSLMNATIAVHSMAQHGAAGRSMEQQGVAGRSVAQHGTAGTYRQSFIGIVEVGQVGNPGAVPGHLVAIQQKAPEQQKHHNG